MANLDSNGNDITPGIGANLNSIWGGIKSFGSAVAGGAQMVGSAFSQANQSTPSGSGFASAIPGAFSNLYNQVSPTIAPTNPVGNIPHPTGGSTSPTGSTKTMGSTGSANDFASAYAGLTPAEQATYAKANPNVDLTNGGTKSMSNSGVTTDANGNQLASYSQNNPDAALTPYRVDTSGSTSGALASGVTANDVLIRRQQMENTYMDAYNKYSQSVLDQKSTQVQNMGNVQNALYSGNTTDFGQGAAGVAQNAANISNALAEIKTQGPLMAAQGMSNMLGFMNQDIQNQLATVPNLQNVQQAADGSIVGFVRDPMTGQITSQNFGNPLLGTFSGQGQTGANIGGGAASTGTGAGAINLPQNSDGTYQTASGGSVGQVYAQKISSLSPQYQSYVMPGPEGTAYIDGSRISALPSQIQMQIQREAANAGIPFLDQAQAGGIQSVFSLYDTLGLMNDLVDQTLSSGPAGHALNWAKSTLNSIFQNDPRLQNFNNLRTLAGQADTNLMRS